MFSREGQDQGGFLQRIEYEMNVKLRADILPGLVVFISKRELLTDFSSIIIVLNSRT